jgi:hypothetical protein
MLICDLRCEKCDADAAGRRWVEIEIFNRFEESIGYSIQSPGFGVENSSARKNRNRHSGCVPAADGLGRSLGLVGG